MKNKLGILWAPQSPLARNVCRIVAVVWWISHVWLCNAMDCSPPTSCLHGIVQARILEWVAISFSRGSSQPRDGTWVSCTGGGFFINWATREAYMYCYLSFVSFILSFSRSLSFPSFFLFLPHLSLLLENFYMWMWHSIGQWFNLEQRQ